MFTLQQLVDAPPAEVVRAFTEPEPFAAWFLAEGFTTPSDRVAIDPRPGGLISAVFVGGDGTEVPFILHFGALDLPHHVELHFDEPAEDITVDLTELPDGRTQLDYRSVGLTDDQQSAIKPGVATMLNHLATYYAS
ncbi:SRPBCC domain-containing protein [Kribbella sp. NPDC026611]|uniref:SRPBCC family protein n=1 Tax=Kribbella sp. NPDC026611 TaxID=3154911 RepID=UPI0033C68D1D